MKKKWLENMQYADDRYIEEADPTKVVSKKRSWRKVWIAVACIALVISMMAGTFAVGYFMAGNQSKSGAVDENVDESVKEHEDDPYYPIIQKLAALKKSEKMENLKGELGFDSGASDGRPEGDLNGGMAPGDDTDGGDYEEPVDGETYEETTDNQVAGVIEGDRLKRSNKYIYYLSENGILYVYSIEGEDSKQVGKYILKVNNSSERFTASQCEFYLSSDCKTVTLMMPVYSFDLGMNCLRVKQIDVSDPADIKEKNEVTVSGQYESTRMVDGDFLVMTHYRLDWETVDYDDKTTFIPQIEAEGKPEYVPVGNIMMPEVLTEKSYTVVARLGGKDLETIDSAAFLSYSNDVYVAKENIYATHTRYEEEKKGNLVTNKQYTDISRLAYSANGFEVKGCVAVEGYTKDRYSLDEYEGILRAVTTTSITQYREYKSGFSTYASDWQSNTSANLYCIDLADMTVKASVEGFAPSGETVQSVRYEGTKAYVCTAIVFTDPVFFFDLSDLTNITYKETEEIEGYSSSLVNFENGNLLGIGQTNWSNLKVEMYKEGEDSVVSICKYTLNNASFSQTYKDYYIDRENQIIGLGVSTWDDRTYQTKNYYIVLHFDGQNLKEVVKTELGGNYTTQRGFYKDGCFYMCGANDFKVKELNLK